MLMQRQKRTRPLISAALLALLLHFLLLLTLYFLPERVSPIERHDNSDAQETSYVTVDLSDLSLPTRPQLRQGASSFNMVENEPAPIDHTTPYHDTDTITPTTQEVAEQSTNNNLTQNTSTTDIEQTAIPPTIDTTSQEQSPIQHESLLPTRSPQKKSIIALTKGYLDSIDYGGHDTFNREGDPTLQSSLEDLQWQSYLKKIFWEINQSLRILGLLSHCPVQGTALLLLTLQCNGKLATIDLTHTRSPNPCEKIALQVIKRAAPFPPIPAHISTQPLHFAMELTLQQTAIRVALARQ